MGNSSTKESRPPGRSRPASPHHLNYPGASSSVQNQQAQADRLIQGIYGSRTGRTGSRPDLSFLGLGSSDQSQPEARRETKQEREARKVEKERAAREKEREKSLKEEGVDGGFLVTLGTYVGPEDFSKPTVRQLQVGLWTAPPSRPLLTLHRLNVVLRPSGKGWMTTMTPGRSTNSSLQQEASPYLPQMRYLQPWKDRLHSNRPEPVRPMRNLRVLRCPSPLDHNHTNPIVPPFFHHLSPRALDHSRRVRQPGELICHSSVGEQRLLPLSPPLLALIHTHS